MKRTKIIIIVIAAILLIAAAIGTWLLSKAISRYEGAEPVRIYIPANSSESAVKDSIECRLGDFGSKVYFVWHLLKSKPARAHGSYLIISGERAMDVARMLRRGAQTPLRLTFNNIRTTEQLAERVSESLEFSASDFLSACDSVLPAMGFKRQEYPAAFLPDTYEFFWTASPETVVSRLAQTRNNYWTDERRAQAAAMGLTPVQVATLASIVEEETAKKDERGKVARLYLNRLDRGMLLQADPTVKYAVGDFSLRRILANHLAVKSPYNTYINPGLPPGPIRIAERATLDAVLDAPKHNFLYMCAKEDFSGYHNFTADYATHQANAQRYRRELNRRNIK